MSKNRTRTNKQIVISNKVYNVLVCICLIFLDKIVDGKVRLSKHPVLIIISYDGFRNDYLNKTATPNLSLVRDTGVSVPYILPQFPTVTFSNHHSISTGLYIETHGIVNNKLYDPLYGRELNGFKDEPGFWNYSNNVVPLWIVNEQAGDERYSGVFMWPGSGETWAGRKPTYFQKYNKTYPFEQRVDTVIDWITNEDKPTNLVFLYYDEPDSKGHDFGPEGPEIKEAIEQMDNITGYMINKLKALDIFDQVNLMFLSDHGLQEVKLESKFVIKTESILRSENETKYSQKGRSPIYQILPANVNETQEIYETFQSAAKTGQHGHFSVYLKENLHKEKPNWHYSNSRRIMPILLVAEKGYVFQDFIKNKNFSKSYGFHGYDNEDIEMRPYFLALGPLFKKGGSVQEPFENIDIFPLVCEIMNISAPAHNGTLRNIRAILNKPNHNGTLKNIPAESSWTLGKVIGVGICSVCALMVIFGIIVIITRRRRIRQRRTITAQQHVQIS